MLFIFINLINKLKSSDIKYEKVFDIKEKSEWKYPLL